MTARNFEIEQQFEAIKKSATDAVKGVFPVEGKFRSIKLNRVWVDDKLDRRDFAGQAKTKARDGTWGVSVYASLSLIDADSKKVTDTKEKVRLFNLPKLTDRNSYIVKGSEY